MTLGLKKGKLLGNQIFSTYNWWLVYGWSEEHLQRKKDTAVTKRAKDGSKHVTKEETSKAKEFMKWWKNYSVIREIQVKTTMKYTRQANITVRKYQVLGRTGSIQKTYTFLVSCKSNFYNHQEAIWHCLEKAWPRIPFWTHVKKEVCLRKFTVAPFIIPEVETTTHPPKWQQMWHIHTKDYLHNHILWMKSQEYNAKRKVTKEC